MSAASDRIFEPLILRDCLHTEPLPIAFAGGQAIVFSTRSPEKTTSNEDSAALIPVGETGGILAIADGVGGHRAGDRASSEALIAIAEAVGASEADAQDCRTAILDGVERANRNILELGIGAATTLAILEVNGRTVRPYHVGDSFILVVGQRGLVKLETIPHSPTGYAVVAGLMDESAALLHEDRHVINNMVGSPGMRIELGSPLALRPKDTVLLASDGLSDNLAIPEIIEVIRKGPLRDAAGKLLKRAQARMNAGAESTKPSKPDDLTFILFRS